MFNYLKDNLSQMKFHFVFPDDTHNNAPFTLKTDTGASKHFVKEVHKKYLDATIKLQNGSRAMLPNKQNITASHQGKLPLKFGLSDKAIKALIYPKITNESLLSIGQLCDDGCLAIFSKKHLHVFTDLELILKGY